MNWNTITNIILGAALAVLAVFAILGAYQWATRKSLKKVDKNLLAMLVPLILIVVTYIIFDKIFVLNTRPDGSGEPSFPSTHTMVVATIFLLAIINLKNYVKNKTLRVALCVIMLALIAAVAVGRVLANKHWTSDVIGGLIFATAFSVIYYLIIRRTQNAKHLHKNH
jgi:undecaprenyl-diphosphatase